MNKTIGIVGLGIMGGAMARNLVQAGWQVFGFDPSPERVAEAKASGVTLCEDVAGIARQTETILTLSLIHI